MSTDSDHLFATGETAMAHATNEQADLARRDVTRRSAGDALGPASSDASPSSAKRDTLAQELVERLWERLPISRLTHEVGHRGIDHIIRAASASHSQIVAHFAELRPFVESICEASINLSDIKPTDVNIVRPVILPAVKQEYNVAKISYLPPRPFVDSEFADLLPEIALQHAKQELERLCMQLVETLLTLLDDLQKNNRIGSAKYGDTACQFTFFTRHVEVANRHITDTEYRRDAQSATVWGHSTDEYNRVKLDLRHRHVGHRHHVCNYALNSPSNTRFEVPRQYMDFYQKIPEWIRLSIRVLEGDLFREERVAGPARQAEAWTEEFVATHWSACPAIVLGPYVLAGWGDNAIEADVRTRQFAAADLARNAALSRAENTESGGKLVAGAAIFGMLLFAKYGTPAAVVAILLALLAMHLAGTAARDRNFGFSDPNVVLHAAGLVGATTFAIQAIILGILSTSWPALLLGGALAVIAYQLSK